MERDDAEAGRDPQAGGDGHIDGTREPGEAGTGSIRETGEGGEGGSEGGEGGPVGAAGEAGEAGETNVWEPISPMTEEEAALFRFIRFGELPGRISPDDTIATVDTRSIQPPDPGTDDRGTRESGV